MNHALCFTVSIIPAISYEMTHHFLADWSQNSFREKPVSLSNQEAPEESAVIRFTKQWRQWERKSKGFAQQGKGKAQKYLL